MANYYKIVLEDLFTNNNHVIFIFRTYFPQYRVLSADKIPRIGISRRKSEEENKR